MRSTQQARFVVVVIGLAVMAIPGHAQQDAQSEREAMYYRYLEFPSYVKGGSIEPHWMADGSSFWYAEGAPDKTVIWKVDPNANTKNALFDTARLRQALAALLGHEPPYQGLPFDKFNFVDESEAAVKFTVENIGFVLQLDTYALTRAPILSKEEKSRLVPQIVRKGVHGRPDLREALSPDRRWFAHLRDYNLWLRSPADEPMVQITNDGTQEHRWGYYGVETRGRWAWWSPDSRKLAVKKGDFHQVERIPIVHWLKPTEEVEWVLGVHNVKTGRRLPHVELYIVDIISKQQVRVDIGEESDQYISVLRWMPDGSELLFVRVDREYKKLDLMAANLATGATRVVLTETQETFVGPPLWLRPPVLNFTLLEDGERFIWRSERDGWNHLYLYNLDGNLIRRLTAGPFVAGRVVAVDEHAGRVYFYAFATRHPYEPPLYQVNLQGEGFARLTETTGRHWIRFSPSKEFFLSTHSSIDRPPVVELRRADGTLLQTLSRANIDALQELRWSPPEEFVVKAADGETDLYGILYKPYDFDSNKKYPVIEVIYAGPLGNYVPRTFLHWAVPQAWAQLGFIVYIVDARGTPLRGKEFQDVTYGNLGRHEIPDHVATLRQLGEKRPYMDLNRVGIIGQSWGGYFATRAMLLAPDVYHVGIAVAPAVYAGGKATVFEPYMGLPRNNKEGYDYADNRRLAGNLKGKLLFIHGTSDVNVPLHETMMMVDALIRAGKPYDLIVLPGHGHRSINARGVMAEYAKEATRRYFQEHLKP